MKIVDLFEGMKPEHVSGEEHAHAVEELENRLLAAKSDGSKLDYDAIDKMMQNVCSEFNLTGQKLHDEFVAKHHQWPDNWIKQQVSENFADGKHPGRKGLAKRSGVNTKASVSSLRNTAKHSTGEKARMAHWLANMKAGKKKHSK